MEMEFRQVQIPYLHCVLYETIRQEERGEAIVPDGTGDMERIVGCCADALMRSRQCQDEILSISGDVQVCVLYQAAGGDEPQELRMYLPFSLRRTVPAESCSCTVSCRVSRAEAQMLGSRRVGVRVTLLFSLRVWSRREQLCFRPETPDRRVQLRLREYPMRLVCECTEKNLLLRDTLPLEAGAPAPARIVHTGARCELTDEKISGSQAVCKGVLRLSLLYRTAEGRLCGTDLPIPFSQLIDLEGSYDEQGLEIVPVLTSAEAMAEDGGVSVEAGICLQCTVTQTAQVPIVEDAYALRGTLHADTQTLQMLPLLDSRVLRQDCALELPAQAGEIVRAEAAADAPQIEWQGETCRIRVPVLVRALYRDHQGLCRQAEGRAELAQELPAAPSLCRAEARIEGQIFAAPGAGRIEMRIPAAVSVRWYDEQTHEGIVSAQLTEGPREVRPSVILRMLEAESSLWEIAKELRTTVSAIQTANDLDAETAPAGTILLIPIVA